MQRVVSIIWGRASPHHAPSVCIRASAPSPLFSLLASAYERVFYPVWGQPPRRISRQCPSVTLPVPSSFPALVAGV